MNVVPVGRVCWHCSVTEDRTVELHKRCGNCRKAIYCSQQCQKSDYLKHKDFCAQKYKERKENIKQAASDFIERAKVIGREFSSTNVEDIDIAKFQEDFKKLLMEKEPLLKESLLLFGKRSAFFEEINNLSNQLDLLYIEIKDL